MSTELTPEQRAAGEATLRAWRRAEPHQVPCHYCGTLVWLQYAATVPDNPADPYDRYACMACGAEGQGHTWAHGRSTRRHRARPVRARIVALAQEYREACRQHEEVMVAVMKEPALPTEVVMETEQRLFDLLQEARAALFGALEELEQVEAEGR